MSVDYLNHPPRHNTNDLNPGNPRQNVLLARGKLSPELPNAVSTYVDGRNGPTTAEWQRHERGPAHAVPQPATTIRITRGPGPRRLLRQGAQALRRRDQGYVNQLLTGPISLLHVDPPEHRATEWLVIDNATAFADCALGRTFTVPFACRETHRAMNGCMKAHATPAEEDAAREEWFAQRLERQHQREAKERRKLEQQKLLREWWNIPEGERDEARRRAEEEKLRRVERVGGYAAKDRRRADEGGPEQR